MKDEKVNPFVMRRLKSGAKRTHRNDKAGRASYLSNVLIAGLMGGSCTAARPAVQLRSITL
ncbi:MAG: hypothetical protein ACRDFQ_07975 [Anaerolineales bacterium]